MKIRPVRAELLHADRLVKLIVAFRNFANLPKNCIRGLDVRIRTFLTPTLYVSFTPWQLFLQPNTNCCPPSRRLVGLSDWTPWRRKKCHLCGESNPFSRSLLSHSTKKIDVWQIGWSRMGHSRVRYPLYYAVLLLLESCDMEMVPNVLGELFSVLLGTAEGSSSEVFVIFHRLSRKL
jgi:hypothetical protein